MYENDIEILVEYMGIMLMTVFSMLLEKNIKMIKSYLLMGSLSGQD